MLVSAIAASASGATLNLRLDVEACEQLLVSIPNVDSGTTIEAPLPGCEHNVLSATLQRVAADPDDGDARWQVEFKLVGPVRVRREDELRVLMQPTMVARTNEATLFVSGRSEPTTTAVAVRRADGAEDTIPVEVPRGVVLTWSVNDD